MPPRVRTLLVIFSSAVVILGAIAFVGASANVARCGWWNCIPKASPTQEKPSPPRGVPLPTKTPESPPAKGVAPSNAPSSAPSSPSPVFLDGNWYAGIDFPAGTYEMYTTDSDCYWYVSDTTGVYLETGAHQGRYRWTFKSGQSIHTKSCGEWKKVQEDVGHADRWGLQGWPRA